MSDSLFKVLVIAALAVTLVLDFMDMVGDTARVEQITEMDNDVDRIAEQITELDDDVDRIAKALNVGDGDS